MTDRTLRFGWTAVALLLTAFLVLAAAGEARAASRSEPASRGWAAKAVVDRALFEDVTARDRARYWVGSECHGDLHELDRGLRRKICYVSMLGFMGSTGRNSAYPTFEPDGTLRRDQAASVIWRLATFGEERVPDGAAAFIDVSSRNVHSDAVRWAAYHGIVEGFDTTPATFRPGDPVTVGQFQTMIDRVKVHWATGGQR